MISILCYVLGCHENFLQQSILLALEVNCREMKFGGCVKCDGGTSLNKPPSVLAETVLLWSCCLLSRLGAGCRGSIFYTVRTRGRTVRTEAERILVSNVSWTFVA